MHEAAVRLSKCEAKCKMCYNQGFHLGITFHWDVGALLMGWLWVLRL